MKALSLLSGGLDSILATKIIQDQGIEVEALSFTSPFFAADKAVRAAQKLGISFHTEDITKEILSLVKSPPHGFGKGANPCIDCHILMVKKAAALMPKVRASFLITGEVLGERPKSQNRWALGIVGEESGWGDYLLRPLTAKNLPPTLPERKGWVNREKLFEIKGRSRRPQLKLAREMGIKEFPAPAGGCLLTDPIFSQKLKDLLIRGKINLNEIELLKVGRHFRLGPNSRLVVGRNEKENRGLLELTTPDDFCFQVASFQGPISILRGEIDEKTLLKAASITCRYSDAPEDGARVEYYRVSRKEKKYLEVVPLKDKELELLRMGRRL